MVCKSPLKIVLWTPLRAVACFTAVSLAPVPTCGIAGGGGTGGNFGLFDPPNNPAIS
jgi:hypothetical protein